MLEKLIAIMMVRWFLVRNADENVFSSFQQVTSLLKSY